MKSLSRALGRGSISERLRLTAGMLWWMMDNIFIRTDPVGNIKADKEKSTPGFRQPTVLRLKLVGEVIFSICCFENKITVGFSNPF